MSRVYGDLLLSPADLRCHEADGSLGVVLKSGTGDKSNLLVLRVLGPVGRWDLRVCVSYLARRDK